MHESKKREETRRFVNESLIHTTKDISTYLAYNELEAVILRKTSIPVKLTLQNILVNKEINNNQHVLKIIDIYQESSLSVIVQKFEGFLPLEMFLELIPEDKLLIFLVYKILKLFRKGLFSQPLDLISLSNIWVNSQGELKVCWFSTVVDNLRLFNNEVYKMNVKSLESINKLIDLNSKHCTKRMYNFPNNSDDQIAYISRTINLCPNMFMQHEKKIIFQEKNTINKAGKRKYGSKKLCIEGHEPVEKIKKPVVQSLDIVQKLVIKMIFYKANILEKDLESKIMRMKDLLNGRDIAGGLSEILHKLSPPSIALLKSLFVDLAYPEDLSNLEKEIDFDQIKESISKIVREIMKSSLKPSEQCSARDIFTKNGFNMEGYSTIAYKKGRFQIYEAIPSPPEEKKDHIEDLLRIVDIQNRQIEMIYRTMKDKKSIDKLEDDQLEKLSKEINSLLRKLTKED